MCTGNLCTPEEGAWLRSLAPSVAVTKGDFDDDEGLEESTVLTVGDFRIGMCHGSGVVPWGDAEALAAVARRLDVDVLVTGHTHEQSVMEVGGKILVNPGSLTGELRGAAARTGRVSSASPRAPVASLAPPMPSSLPSSRAACHRRPAAAAASPRRRLLGHGLGLGAVLPAALPHRPRRHGVQLHAPRRQGRGPAERPRQGRVRGREQLTPWGCGKEREPRAAGVVRCGASRAVGPAPCVRGVWQPSIQGAAGVRLDSGPAWLSSPIQSCTRPSRPGAVTSPDLRRPVLSTATRSRLALRAQALRWGPSQRRGQPGQ